MLKTIEIEVRKTSYGKYHVFLNGVCASVFYEEHNAEEYAGDIRRLNPYSKIKRIIKGEKAWAKNT